MKEARAEFDAWAAESSRPEPPQASDQDGAPDSSGELLWRPERYDVHVLVGPGEARFGICSSVLPRWGGTLPSLVSEPESELPTMSLPAVSPQDFEVFLRWCYPL